MLPVFYIMVDAALKSTVLLAAAWVAGLLLKNHSAASRHLMRALALAGCLLLPIFSLLLPAWHMPGLPRYNRSDLSVKDPQNEERVCLSCDHEPHPAEQNQAQRSVTAPEA